MSELNQNFAGINDCSEIAIREFGRTDGGGNLRSVKFCALLRKVSLFLQMKEKLPSIYVIKHEVKFIIRLEIEDANILR